MLGLFIAFFHEVAREQNQNPCTMGFSLAKQVLELVESAWVIQNHAGDIAISDFT